MHFTRLYTGEDKQSHFEILPMDFTETQYGKLSTAMKTESISFGEIDMPREIDWHNPPTAQFILMLEGAMEIEIGDGTKKIFHVGDILLAEDVTGQGHITRAASEGIRHYLIAPIAK